MYKFTEVFSQNLSSFSFPELKLFQLPFLILLTHYPNGFGYAPPFFLLFGPSQSSIATPEAHLHS